MWQLPHSACQRSLRGVVKLPPAIASCATSAMLARSPNTQAAMSRIQRLVVSIRCLLFDRHQVLQHVALLLRGAGAAEHVVAVPPEPLVYCGGVGKPLRVCGGRERRDRLSGLRVLACPERVRGMAGRAAPLRPVRRLEEGLASLGRKTAKAWAGCARFALEALLLLDRRCSLRRNGGEDHRACATDNRPFQSVTVHVVSAFIVEQDSREGGLTTH